MKKQQFNFWSRILMLLIIIEVNLKNQELMNFEQARQSKLHSAYKQKFYENDNQNPLGNYKLILNDYHKREPFLTIGPNYLIFAFIFLVVNISTIILLFKLSKFDDVRPFFLILTVALIFLDVAWLATALINPGISATNTDEGGEYCEICEANNDIQIVKKNGRFHCPECDICIDQHESHFKVVGGCVGKNNFIAFKVLLLGIFIWGLSMVTIVPLAKNL